MVELSKQFRFDAAHTLERSIATGSSRRIHGHSYRAEVTVRGRPDLAMGTVDLRLLERSMEGAGDALDHRFLDEVNDLGPPAMKNLSRWIRDRLQSALSNLHRVCVFRGSSEEACSYLGEGAAT